MEFPLKWRGDAEPDREILHLFITRRSRICRTATTIQINRTSHHLPPKNSIFTVAHQVHPTVANRFILLSSRRCSYHSEWSEMAGNPIRPSRCGVKK